MVNDKHSIDMCEGPLFGKIIRFTLPLILMNALQLLYNAADMIIVGRFEGDLSVAAVGATSPLINLIVNVFIGLSVGVNVCVGNYIGAKRDKDTRDTVSTSAILGFFSGLAVLVLGMFISDPILKLMDTPTEIFDSALLYAHVYFLGAPANLLYNFMAAVLRAKGDTKRPLYILLFSGILNVVLNLVFVAAFGLGVLGVAVATVISQYASVAVILFIMMRDKGVCGISHKNLHLNKEILKKLISLGLPAGMQSSVFSLSNMVIQSAINSFGAEAIAGNTAASNIDTFAYIAFNAFQATAVAFIAQNRGARNMKRIESSFKICLISAIVVAVAVGWAIYFFSDILLDFYLPEQTEAVSFGAIRMKYICLPYFFLAMLDVTVGALRGLGSTLIPTIITIVGSCGVRILWIVTVFKAFSTPDVLYISFPLAWIVTFFALLIAYFIVKKKETLRLTE